MRKIYVSAIFFICILFTSCIYKIGGAEIYKATAETQDGIDTIQKYNIKYISPSTYSLYFITFYKKKGAFAYNVTEKNDEVSYDKINQEFADKLKLKPSYTFWQKYGLLIGLGVVGVLFGWDKLVKVFSKEKK